MVLRWLRYLSPGRWITSFSLWWLKLDLAAVAAARGEHVKQEPNSIAVEVRTGAAYPSLASAMGGGLPGSPLSSTQQPNCVSKAEDGHIIKANVPTNVVGHNHSSGVQDSFGPERPRWQNTIRDSVLTWDFNVFDLNNLTEGNPLITVTLTLLETHQLLDGWKVSREKLTNYLLRIEREYNLSAYHNNIHAADVTQTAAIILRSFAGQVSEVPKLETFCVIVAAAVHDLGHLGVNNDFLINSKHPRATRYNDKSVNEMFHISRAFEIMREGPQYDIFDGFTPEEAKRARKLMVDMVLATDMAIHFDLLKRFNIQLEAEPNLNEWTDRVLIYQMAVHLADIANPSRPFHLARGWAERVIQEFCEQGDKEVACGLTVSPMCDRSKMNMPRAQINFIDIFLRPTLAAFERAAPDFTQMAAASLELTILEWKKLEDAGFKL